MTQTMISQRLVDRTVASRRDTATAELERLLRAARTVLVRHGYDGLRVDEVLAEAGLSTRAFYRHFQGKSELFLALFDEETARAAERLRVIVDAAVGPEAKVRAWVEAVLDLAYDARLGRRTGMFAAEGPRLAREFPED